MCFAGGRGGVCAGSGALNFNVQNINTAIAHRTKSTKSRSASYRRRTNKFLVTARSKKRDSHAIVFCFFVSLTGFVLHGDPLSGRYLLPVLHPREMIFFATFFRAVIASLYQE